MSVGILFAFLAFLPAAIYLLVRRLESKLIDLGLLLTGTVSLLLVAIYFFYISFFIALPADIVIWSESDFVNDILKFRAGYPIFTAQVNNESFPYTPGSQIFTYFLSGLAGHPLSVPVYRSIQVFYTVITTIIAFICCRRLVEITGVATPKIDSRLWSIVSFSILFLIATNSITNPFSHLLHNDSLAQLLTVTMFWMVLEYEATRKWWILLLLVLAPALGFWVKQSLLLWAGVLGIYFLVFDRPRSLARIAGFGLGSLAAIALSVYVGYALWQDNFVYWVFTVLAKHEVSPLRSVRNLLIVWPYFAIGLLGGGALMQFAGGRRLLAPWLIWLFLISAETYTSGIAWMTNHIGPGSLIGGIFFLAAIAVCLQRSVAATLRSARFEQWIGAATCVAAACLLFSGLGLVRIPTAPFSEDDGRRYVREIESEFAGQPIDRVLVDFGTWVYQPSGTVMKDRAASIGERGYSQTGDFSGILERLSERYYEKILVRNFHSGNFWYDHEFWSRSSTIRNSLYENYREVGRIKPVSGIAPGDMPYGFSEISILVPRDY